jgi:S1/P1 Nuclease
MFWPTPSAAGYGCFARTRAGLHRRQNRGILCRARELASSTTGDEQRRLALQFLLHLVGDLHQPLHAGDDHDQGGNRKFASAPGITPNTLHHQWDTEFVVRLGANEAEIARRLLAQVTDAKRAQWSTGTPDAWAMESWSVAKRHAYGLLPRASAPDYYELPEAYVSDASAVTAEQLSKSGVRLAWLLNRRCSRDGAPRLRLAYLHVECGVDILPALQRGDSLGRRSMSRTEEDIPSGVDITIMRHPTLRTSPASYSELCDAFRPRLARAKRTDSGRARFIDFLVPGSVRSRFVAEHVSEGRPACIENRFRQAGFSESGGIHIAHGDVIELSNDAGRELVVKVPAGIDHARVEVPRLAPFAGVLGGRELVGELPQKPGIPYLLPVGEGGEVLKAQVDANAAAHRPRVGLRDFNDDVQEPMASGITREVRPVLDLACRQSSRVEYPKCVSGKAKGLSLALQIAAFERHPAQGAPAAPAQKRPVPLTARLGVLFAHCIDSARVQAEFVAATRCQPIQIKAARPTLIPFQRMQLRVVTEIPDEVAGSGLSLEQTRQGLDTVSIHQEHRRKLMCLTPSDKTPKLAETHTFTQAVENPDPRERHFLGGARAGVSVLENR